jgi:hypothetical protein
MTYVFVGARVCVCVDLIIEKLPFAVAQRLCRSGEQKQRRGIIKMIVLSFYMKTVYYNI